MTAPVAPSGPALSPMESVIADSMSATLTEHGITPLRDPETGRFAPREEDVTAEEANAAAKSAPEKGAKPETQADGATDGEEPPADPELPEGFVALPSAEGQKLATKFQLLDKDGELDIPSGLIVKATFNGREESLPLDQLVRRAQSGAWNQQREARITEVDDRNRQLEQAHAQVNEQLALRDRQLEALLADEAYRQRAIEEYQQLQTPEARIQRAEQRVEQERQAQERNALAAQGQQYLNGEVAPALAKIAEALPTVSTEELVFKMKAFVDRQIDPRLGMVHPSRYAAINRFVTEELVPWAQHAHEARSSGSTTPAPAKPAAPDAANAATKAQRAKRLGTAQFKPSVAAPRSQEAASTTPRSHRELVDDAISSALSAVSSA